MSAGYHEAEKRNFLYSRNSWGKEGRVIAIIPLQHFRPSGPSFLYAATRTYINNVSDDDQVDEYERVQRTPSEMCIAPAKCARTERNWGSALVFSTAGNFYFFFLPNRRIHFSGKFKTVVLLVERTFYLELVVSFDRISKWDKDLTQKFNSRV